MSNYSCKIIDIESRKPFVILHRNDAKKESIKESDRLQVFSAQSETIAFSLLTSSLLQEGEIGMSPRLATHLSLEAQENVTISSFLLPKSLSAIRKKVKGSELSKEEIIEVISDISHGKLTQAELAAFVLGEYFVGLTNEEMQHLIQAMASSGEQLDFEEPVYDKHSTGGVPGNKVSLLVVPIVAAAGLLIPKTSSRAVTSPSGTGDTMEILAPVSFSKNEIIEIAKKTKGCIVWGGSLNVAPADDEIIRDVTFPLGIEPRYQMIASILSKKLAFGVDFLVMDVPTGIGTKVPSVEEGRTISRLFIELAESVGIQMSCAVTYGSDPVGHAMGAVLEAKEALSALIDPSKGPTSLVEKSTSLAGILFELAGLTIRGEGKKMAWKFLESGKAYEKMKQIIEAQGGNPNIKPEDLDSRIDTHTWSWRAPTNGRVVAISNSALSRIARIAGAPRNPGAGIYLNKKKETVKAGEKVYTIHAPSERKLNEAMAQGAKLKPFTIEGMVIDLI